MSQIYALAAPISTKNTNVEDIRKSVTYHPSVWKSYFLSYTSDITEISAHEKEQLQKQKKKVQNLLAQTPDESTVKIELIDAIQRLGVGYHFVKEIEESLRQIHETQIREDEDDVRVVALRFRLLRQQGYRASCDVFKRFTDHEGNFKESLKKDVEGMLSLYEASYYGVNGEEIMDKALQFSSSHLQSLVQQTSTTTTTTTITIFRRLQEALDTPISKTLIRLGATKFIYTYQEDESHDKDLLDFAKLDFNILQKMHQEEANHVTRWWEDMGLVKKLGFPRDRLVECYFWSLGLYFEPQYKAARIFLAKVLAMATIVDDIYDVYGSLDELGRFTHAIRSWDITAADELPPYMRICYEALLGVYEEMGDQIGVPYAIQTMKEMVESYLEEAEWCYTKYVPTMEEYMKLALVSVGYLMVATNSLAGINENSITKNDFDWIANRPPILRASELLTRLMDDLAGYGKEEKISAVSCYMKEHGCSEEEASRELWKQVNKAWKDLNDGWMEPRVASTEILARVVNQSRISNILYSTGEDGFSDSTKRTKQFVKSLLVDPIN